MEDVSGRLAQLEIRMAIATLLQHFTPVLCDKSVVSLCVCCGGVEGSSWGRDGRCVRKAGSAADPYGYSHPGAALRPCAL